MHTILVVEDDLKFLDNICTILKLAGYKSLKAANGTIGLQLAIEQQPDLILCDIMLEDLDGFGLLKILAERKDTNHIPLVFLTAKKELKDLRRGMNLGAADYITKPFYKDELLQVIKMQLKKALNSAMYRQSQIVPLNQLLQQGEYKEYKKGETIFKSTDAPRDLYKIKAGYVKLQRTTDFGKTLIFEVLQSRDFLGLNEVLSKAEKYAFDAVALVDTRLESVSAKEFFKNDLDQNTSKVLLQDASRKIIEANNRTIVQCYCSVRKRCASTLLLADATFKNADWPLSREELSHWAGTAKETLIRNLTDFKNQGWIEIKNKQINIISKENLEKVPS